MESWEAKIKTYNINKALSVELGSGKLETVLKAVDEIEKSKKYLRKYAGKNGKWIYVYNNPDYDHDKVKDGLNEIDSELRDLFTERKQLMVDMEQEVGSAPEDKRDIVGNEYGGKLNEIDDKINSLKDKRRKLFSSSGEIHTESNENVPASMLQLRNTIGKSILDIENSYFEGIISKDSFDKAMVVCEEDYMDIIKGKSFPIGTIHNGYKKVRDGVWKKVSSKGMTKEEHEKKSDEYYKSPSSVGSDLGYEHSNHAKKLDDKEYKDEDVIGEKVKFSEGDNVAFTFDNRNLSGKVFKIIKTDNGKVRYRIKDIKGNEYSVGDEDIANSPTK